MELRWNPPSVDSIRAYLDQIAQRAPDDDRIWLARANLAIRTGSLDEAARLIEACLKRRPEDPAAWRARLEWAVRTHRLNEARAAIARLRDQLLDAASFHRLSAWLAAACGDFARERRELRLLIEAAPEDFDALARLEKSEPRQSPETIELERRKTEIERAQARYRELYRRNQPARDAEEMTHLAERLGHPFEALAFVAAALADAPNRSDLKRVRDRLEKASRESTGARRYMHGELETECGPSASRSDSALLQPP